MNNKNNETKELRYQIEQLEKLSSLGALCAGIAHEIQNPLNFVMNFGKMCMQLTAELNELLNRTITAETRKESVELVCELLDNLRRMDEHCNRALSLMQDILLYTREHEEEFISLAPARLVREYANLAYHAVRATNKQFNVNLNESLDEKLIAEIIPQDFCRVILNLLNNAYYAVERKRLSCAANYRPEVRISLTEKEGNMLLEIEDNGTGIPEKIGKDIFFPFFTTKPAGEGTGLGLAITRNIVADKHHGCISMESKENEYTRFIVAIPLKKQNPV